MWGRSRDDLWVVTRYVKLNNPAPREGLGELLRLPSVGGFESADNLARGPCTSLILVLTAQINGGCYANTAAPILNLHFSSSLSSG